MRKFLLLVCALFLVGTASAGAQTQVKPDSVVTPPQMLPRFVIMDDYIRAMLAKDWDAEQGKAIQLERAYCLRWQYDIWAHEVAYRVTQISPASVTSATESSIYASCPAGADVAEIHVHPPQTCTYDDNGEVDKCWLGGPYANECLPSDADRAYVKYTHEDFNMVQCGRESIVFYFATGDNR